MNLVFAFLLMLASLAFDPLLVDASNVIRFVFAASGVLVASIDAFRHKAKLSLHFGEVALLLFVLLLSLSALWAPNTQEALYETSRWIVAALLLIIASRLFRTHQVRSVILLSRISGIVFLIGVAAALVQIFSAGDMQWSSRYCVTSLFTHKGTFCCMILLLSAFPLMRLCLPIRRGRWIYILLLIAALGFLLFLQSRAALVGLATAILSGILFRLLKQIRLGRLSKVAAIVLLSLVMSGTIIGGSFWIAQHTTDVDQHASGLHTNASIAERQTLWSMTFRMVQQHPLLGCGAGNWKVCHAGASVRDVFSLDVLDFSFVRPHNDYLRILSETGIIGFLLLMTALSALFVTVISALLGKSGRLVRTGASILMGICAFAFFDFPIDRTETLCWTMLLAGFVGSCCNTRSRIVLPHGTWMIFALMAAGAVIFGMGRWQSERQERPIREAIHNSCWTKVESLCDKALNGFATLTPAGIPYAYYQGMAQEYLGKSPLATFRKAHANAPFNRQVLCDLGRLEYTQCHDTTTSLALLRQAIWISPSYSYAYFNMAQILMLEGRHDEASDLLISFDLEGKQQRIDQLIWQYHQGEEVQYYQQELVPAERAMRDQMLSQIQN